MTADPFIVPDWPAPRAVRALCTTRAGGVSGVPYDTFNLADHVGDAPECVRENRRRLQAVAALPATPVWLRQVHGTRVIDAAKGGAEAEADGSMANARGVVCAVLTADCLPVLLCDRAGMRVAALHAGWRGLAGGIIESGVAALSVPPESLLAWLGPAIGPRAFEVGPEVRAAFLQGDAEAASAFVPHRDRYLADLYALARRRLARAGVGAVYGGGLCTVAEPERFYSYRRDGRCGRMASLIWLAPADA